MINGITVKHSYDGSTIRIEIGIDREIIENSPELMVRVNTKAPRTRIPSNQGSRRRTIDF